MGSPWHARESRSLFSLIMLDPTCLFTRLGSARPVNAWIQEESSSAGIPTSRIVLGGFSQGCAMTLLTAVMSKPKEEGGIGKLAGFFGVS